ncbi:MAG: TetR/AcrR family transcriptional regulator [Alphaproteobacteria bacterium]|uniref:TetR/AcrR family transcriptional regulator n=1 Tax=Candidatus Nitrobium versatile TaxID=2884831 RepID=A0A953SH89_9BACT|nr:TetR/AcrR family transcriptional regulator [Candidatus Nitrobium versatile]
MITGKPRERKNRETRREQIAQAALRIIAQRGVRALTTASIAQEVGISEANLYRHFKNKDEILSEMVEIIGNDIMRSLKDVFGSDGAPAEKLRRIFVFHLTLIESNEGIPRLVFSEEMHRGNKELREKFLALISRYAEQLHLLIREGQEAGAFRQTLDPLKTATMFIGMVQISTLLWSLKGFTHSLVDEGMEMWENFEKCIQVE